jgi:microsomal epoxide hydrolase
VGLAAWIVEKFRTWSDCGGDVERRFTKDELPTDVMLYWVTGAINCSFWPYSARRPGAWPLPEGQRIAVPTASASFPREILHRPRAPGGARLQHHPALDLDEAGGHFAALEAPAADTRDFFRPLRRFEGGFAASECYRGVSRTSRTLRARLSALNGFWRKAFPRSSTP